MNRDDLMSGTDARGEITLTSARFTTLILRAVAMCLIASAAFIGTPAHAQDPPAKIALTNARIISMVGDEIESGTVLIDRGRIIAVGGGCRNPLRRHRDRRERQSDHARHDSPA